MKVTIKRFLSFTPLIAMALLALDLILHEFVPKKAYYFESAEELNDDAIASMISETGGPIISLTMKNSPVWKEDFVWFDVFSAEKFSTIVISGLTVSFDGKDINVPKKFAQKKLRAEIHIL